MHSQTIVWRRLSHRLVFSLLAITVAFTTRAVAAVPFQIEETTLGPANSDASYVFSPHGAHLAIVARKGSRWSVIVDGVAGPRVEDVLTPAFGWIDTKHADAVGRRYGSLAANVRPARPVAFSEDGRHFAYLAKMSDQFVLFRDGREVQRMPGGPQSDAFRLEFAGAEGNHLMFIHGTESGDEFWVDGRKWPGYVHDGAYGTFGAIDPVVSPDGEHIACTATVGGHDVTELDGKPTGYNGENLQFTSDSRHLVCLVQTPTGASVLADGKPLLSAREVLNFSVAPAGLRVAAIVTHFNPQTKMREGVFLVVDGQPVPTTLGDEIKGVCFSPDGKHYAAICGKTGTRFIVIDGRKGEEYDDIDSDSGAIQGPAFSPDSSKLVYLAHAAGKAFVVVNTDESDAFDGWPQYWFSPDGRHVAIVGARDGQAVLVMDGTVVVRFPQNRSLAPVVFSPDSRRYIAGDGLVIDGKTTADGPLGPCTFSPDSRHFATASNVLYVDGHAVTKYGWIGIGRAFSPDSRHVCWIARQPATNPDAAPNSYEEVIYVDGQPALHLDDFENGPMNLRALYTAYVPNAPWLMPREWSFGDDGTLTCIGPAGGVMKRFKISLGSATSLDSAAATTNSGSSTPGAATASVAAQRSAAAPAASAATMGAAGRPGAVTPGTPAATQRTTAEPGGPLGALASLFGRKPPSTAPKAGAKAGIEQAKQKVNDAAKKASAWLDALGK